MADEPDSLTIQILRQIQEKLVDHERHLGRMQGQIDHRFDGVERKIGELIDSTARALGTAAVANVRHDSASQHFAELELELRDPSGPGCSGWRRGSDDGYHPRQLARPCRARHPDLRLAVIAAGAGLVAGLLQPVQGAERPSAASSPASPTTRPNA